MHEHSRYTPPPPLGPKLGNFLNLDYFEIFVPPFTLSKTIPKSYLTVTLGLFQSYISHICKKFAYISPIYDPFIILIKAIFQSFEFEKNMKIKISHPSHSNMHFELWTFFLRTQPQKWRRQQKWKWQKNDMIYDMINDNIYEMMYDIWYDICMIYDIIYDILYDIWYKMI